MSWKPHILVCPFPSKAFDQLQNANVLVRANVAPDIVSTILKSAREKALNVDSIWLRSHAPVSDLDVAVNGQKIRIVVEADSLGDMPTLVKRLDELVAENVTFLFSPANSDNCLASQILASLGVRAGVDMLEGDVDWEAVSDLACYALYSKSRRAPVEPFDWTAWAYHENRYRRVSFGEFFLSSPGKFLHLAPDGRVALNPRDLKREIFLCDNVASLHESLHSDAYRMAESESFGHLADQDDCAYCPGWRLCGGQFKEERVATHRCSKFFTELLEAVEFYEQTM